MKDHYRPSTFVLHVGIDNITTVKLASWRSLFWKVPSSSSDPDKEVSTKSPTLAAVPITTSEQRVAINRKMSTKRIAIPTPELTPSLCFNGSYLRDFLRLSRAQLDDTISTNLNSLLTPSVTSPFDPASTADPATNRRGKQPIPGDLCRDFTAQTIFPIWSSRSKVLSYCSIVATSPDPDDPDRSRIEAESIAHSHRVVDERLDPYSGRFFPKEPRTEILAGVLRNENAVENIVRERTWRILNERCNNLDPSQSGWPDAVKSWQNQLKQ